MKVRLLLPVLFYSFSLWAQPRVVADIYPGGWSSRPSKLTVYKDKLCFFAIDPSHGVELWETDGVQTTLVKDIYTGGGNLKAPIIDNKPMAVMNGKLYFPPEGTYIVLYSYDGQDVNFEHKVTNRVQFPGIADMVVLDDKLYFNTNTGNSGGNQLWVYDPFSDQATQISFEYTFEGAQSLTAFKGRLYFTAGSSSAKGNELYVYDPGTKTVSLAADIYPGVYDSYPMNLTTDGNALFFTATGPDYGRELYSYNGHSVQRLTDLNPGWNPGLHRDEKGLPTIGIIGDVIYFAGSVTGTFQLYKYELLTGNTSLVATINNSGHSMPAGFIYYANKVFFVADDGVHGRELWVLNHDNTVSMVADIISPPTTNEQPDNLTVYNGKLYFTAMGDLGDELYEYADPEAIINDEVKNNITGAYPNPVATTLHCNVNINSGVSLSVVLYDISGRVVYKSGMKEYGPGNHTISIPVATLPSAMYYYNITKDHGEVLGKGKVVKM